MLSKAAAALAALLFLASATIVSGGRFGYVEMCERPQHQTFGADPLID